ncbi:aromatase [Orenia metallireducens]|jgi:aromatase|uniref:Aromatase n=1 Tax=Orenia metallireducens TaxID=1413210 RepID=A0A285I3R5_9FIRM|nr:SRPBCC family protein [Orenia metallireducens]PRX23130.1 aromatase [Orenia metallireducens]SNY42497.1 aromatase [Orenia metallireducens]
MKGYTENSIIVEGNVKKIFNLSNNISKWPQLFTEYEKVDILEEKDGYIKFRLTKFPNQKGEVKSWVSERYIDKDNLTAKAKRLDPLYPFTYMHINWKYEVLPQNTGVLMKWIQEFELDEKCSWSSYRMESYLNHSTRIQMKAVKEAIEKELAATSKEWNYD